MRLGIIARSDNTGLGNQSRNLVYMLKPSKVLVVNSTSFSAMKKQNNDWYEGFNSYVTRSWPTSAEARAFLRNIDVLLSCETFYTPVFIQLSKALRIKTALQYNYEFLDNTRDPHYPIPDILLAPSHWKIDEMKANHNLDVTYLPPPTDSRRFAAAREENFAVDGKRFLHIVGRFASHDRNGTITLIEALKRTNYSFHLTIKSQFPLDDIDTSDTRITMDYSSPANEEDLYKGYDALILPRKYAGLCLPMNEALMSGLPVIMTNVEPNNKILPKKWLVDSYIEQMIMTRTLIESYSADVEKLAKKIEWLCDTDLGPEKAEAFEIGYNNYSYDALLPKYQEVLGL